MFKVDIEPHWRIGRAEGGNPLDATLLLRLLTEVQTHQSITVAARQTGLSYRHAWGLIQAAESHFGARLLDTQRGRGATLTNLATTLLRADRLIQARLLPTLQTLSSELEGELNRVTAQDEDSATRPLRLHASHGFAVAAMLEELDRRDVRVELSYRNSTEAVASLARQECDLAGFHVPLGEFEHAAVDSYRQWLDPKRHVLIHLAMRNQGLFLARGNPKRIYDLHDLLKPQVRFVNRQAGSGTRLLLEMMLAGSKVPRHQIQGYDTAEFTHAAVAAHVASGMADVGLGVETAARRFNLDFVPLIKERYFFAAERRALHRPPVSTTIALIRSEDYKMHVRALRGYDATHTGLIQTLEEAFPDWTGSAGGRRAAASAQATKAVGTGS